MPPFLIRMAMQGLVQRVALTLLTLLFSLPAMAREQGEVTIMADSSLTVPLIQIARLYTKQKNVQVTTIFGSSKNQIPQIEAGEDTNVFIAAKPAWISELQSKGLTDIYSQTVIAGNELVWVTTRSRSNATRLSRKMQGQDFVDEWGGKQCYFGDPEYLAEGTYTLATLKALDLMGEMEPCFAFMQDHGEMIRAVQRYQGYGFVFLTDAKIFPELVMLDGTTEAMHGPIQYHAVVVAGAGMQAGREFLEFLKSKAAQAVFAQFHFVVPAG